MPERLETTGDPQPPPSPASIGCRVEVYFKVEASFYEGVITKYDSAKGWFVEYDDGDKAWELGERKVRLLSFPDPTPTQQLEFSQSGASGYSMSFEDMEEEDQGQPQYNNNYSVETQVEANYKQQGKWLSGKIKKAHGDGHYDIEYSDGWRYERGVVENNLRSLDAELSVSLSQPAFPMGAVVEARWGGKHTWYKGKVKCSYPGREVYDVEYDDGDTEKNIAGTLIRLFVEPKVTKEPEKESDAAVEVTVDGGDKIARSQMASPYVEAGMVSVHKRCIDKLLHDDSQGLLKFPNAKDDLNDAFVQAINRLLGQPKTFFF